MIKTTLLIDAQFGVNSPTFSVSAPGVATVWFIHDGSISSYRDGYCKAKEWLQGNFFDKIENKPGLLKSTDESKLMVNGLGCGWQIFVIVRQWDEIVPADEVDQKHPQ